MRSCECIIWKDSETPPFESLSSSRHLYRDYFLHYSITSKAPFHLPKKYSISRKGGRQQKAFWAPHKIRKGSLGFISC